LKTKLHKSRLQQKENAKLKEIESATQLEIFNKACRKAGLIMEFETPKEGFDTFDDLHVDLDAFRDDEEEAMQEELILQQKLEAEKKIENTIQGKEEK
jgi:hypothetical protein